MAKAPKNRPPPRKKAKPKPRTAAPKRESAGRPSEYKPEYAAVAKKLCELGATDSDLAHAFEVSRSTIFTWRATHPDFLDACEVGKQAADDRVVRSLYERANGYSYDSCKIFLPKDAPAPVIVPYVEHVPPSDTAAIFWLKNRRPKEWRDRSQHELSGPDGGPIKTEGGMTDREAGRLIARALLKAKKAREQREGQSPKEEPSATSDADAGE